MHRVLRTQFYGSRRTCIARLRHVWLAEVAMLEITCVVLITLFSLTRADQTEICPVRVGGDCGSQVPHREEVWFIAPFSQCHPAVRVLCLCTLQHPSCPCLFLCMSPVCALTHRKPRSDHCAPRATRWDWQRRLSRSMGTQLQPFSPKWLTKASLQTSSMKMRRYIWDPDIHQHMAQMHYMIQAKVIQTELVLFDSKCMCLSVFGIQGHQSTSTSSFPGYSKGPYSQNQRGQRGWCWGRSVLGCAFAVVFICCHFIWWMTKLKKTHAKFETHKAASEKVRPTRQKQNKYQMQIEITQEITL